MKIVIVIIIIISIDSNDMVIMGIYFIIIIIIITVIIIVVVILINNNIHNYITLQYNLPKFLISFKPEPIVNIDALSMFNRPSRGCHIEVVNFTTFLD